MFRDSSAPHWARETTSGRGAVDSGPGATAAAAAARAPEADADFAAPARRPALPGSTRSSSRPAGSAAEPPPTRTSAPSAEPTHTGSVAPRAPGRTPSSPALSGSSSTHGVHAPVTALRLRASIFPCTSAEASFQDTPMSPKRSVFCAETAASVALLDSSASLRTVPSTGPLVPAEALLPARSGPGPAATAAPGRHSAVTTPSAAAKAVPRMRLAITLFPTRLQLIGYEYWSGRCY